MDFAIAQGKMMTSSNMYSVVFFFVAFILIGVVLCCLYASLVPTHLTLDSVYFLDLAGLPISKKPNSLGRQIIMCSEPLVCFQMALLGDKNRGSLPDATSQLWVTD